MGVRDPVQLGDRIAFEFFLSLIGEGSVWVINTVIAANPTAFTGCINVAPGNLMPHLSCIDALVYTAITGPTVGFNDKVIGFSCC